MNNPKIKITDDFNKRLEILFTSEKEILLELISIIGSIDYNYLCKNKTFTTIPIIIKQVKAKKDIPLLPILQYRNTINLFIDKKHQKIVSDENSKIKFQQDPDPQRFIGIFFDLKGEEMKHSFEECLLGSDNIYTDGCVYYFINVPKIIDDYFKKQKLSILEKLIIILGVDDKKEMKKVAGENTRLIDLVNKINEGGKHE